MKFTLEIRLGNDAMQTPEDVAWMLRKAADETERRFGQIVDGCAFSLQDVNGNTCGKARASDDDDAALVAGLLADLMERESRANSTIRGFVQSKLRARQIMAAQRFCKAAANA